MKIETTIGTIIIVGGVAFLVGAQYGYYKTRQRYVENAAKELIDRFRDQ